MDRGKSAVSRGRRRSPHLPVRAPYGRWRDTPLPSVARVQASRLTECPSSPEQPRPGAGRQPELLLWADLPADILGLVAGRLPRADDRARLRSVCRAWRAAARVHGRAPPPLPLLVLSNFTFSSLSADGAMTGLRRIPLPSREMAAGVRCVGSFEGWLVAVQLNEGRYFGDGRCFLMNVFTRDVVRLPPPSVTHLVDAHSKSIRIVNGSGAVNCTVNGAQYVMSFCKVVLSSSPYHDGNGGCIVAAISVHRSTASLALWRPGMTSWCVCQGGCISKFSDIALYQGKVYMFSKVTTNLFVFDISEDDSGLMVSRVERCVTQLPEVKDSYGQRWNIVEWHGKLLLVVTYLGAEGWHNICKIGVFEVDLSTNPFRFTEINSLDGDCIFISPCSSNSLRACLYDGVKDDLIYFVDGGLNTSRSAFPFDKFVYNMRDGTMAPFAADIADNDLRARDGSLMNPTWLFPSE